MSKTKLLILGASGMLGSTLLRWFAKDPKFEVYGTVRSLNPVQDVKLGSLGVKLIPNINIDNLAALFSQIKPDLVINCIGVVKQLVEANDPLVAIPINSLLPHRLASLAQVFDARLIHFSTDCVFSGARGCYLESDIPDATDLYGRSKLLGEVDYPNAVTLRTSIIGHELVGSRSLIDWFLSQNAPVKGYKRAIFSGLPTVEIARVIRDFVIPNTLLHGLYHLSAEPINKFNLLSVVAEVYSKSIDIIPDENLVIDRSLNSDRFRAATGFSPRSWDAMIKSMYEFH